MSEGEKMNRAEELLALSEWNSELSSVQIFTVAAIELDATPSPEMVQDGVERRLQLWKNFTAEDAERTRFQGALERTFLGHVLEVATSGAYRTTSKE